MYKMLTYLSNPYLVSYVQRKFGIVYIKKTKCQKDDESSQTKSNNIHTVDLMDNEKCFYTINNYVIFYFFLFITHVGNEVFYILFLPILSWNFDDITMYLTCISWSISMYLGQVTKDLIKIPRPLTPPVIKLEVKYLREYGFPSTHAMGSFSISFTLLYLLFTQSEISYLNCFLFTSTALIVCFCVCLSRIYLGMHSFLDIVGGLAYSFIISLFYLTFFSNYLLFFLKEKFLNGLLLIVVFILLCFLYPCKKGKSSARADTFLIMGCAVGLTLGVSLKFTLNLENVGKIRNFNQNLFQLYLMRSIAGTINILIGRVLSKQTIYLFVKLKYKYVQNVKNDEIKEFINQNFNLEMFSYLFCYTVVSFSAIFTSFILFEYLELY